MAARGTDWEAVGYIKRSRNRARALAIMSEPTMPSELGKRMGISLTHASKICRELCSKGFIRCLNDSLTKGRIYLVTEKGKKALCVLDSLNKVHSS